MFWKSVRLQFWEGTLVKKMMIFYSLSTMGILFTLSLFLYPSVNKLLSEKRIQSIHITMTDNKANRVSIECFKKVILALLLGSLGSLCFGYLVAKNGLKRINEFSSLMKKISAVNLKERVNPSEWPKELKDLGFTFNVMLDRIELAFVQLNQFSYDLAHELRNPINNLQGMTEVALTKAHLTPFQSIFESHLEEYSYLSRLIENLLFIARSENKQISLNKEGFNVSEVIKKIMDYYQACLDEKQINLIVESSEIELKADIILFKRIINNLLSNAIYYTPTGGIILFYIDKKENLIEISIQDSGQGIDPIHFNKLFTRFHRADSSRCTKTGGLGLGLAIVKSIMDLHQGTVSIKSEINKGTIVYLQFP
jgi:two-component system, OmpR family, heavy metal sensor histidine kinase CusS